MKIQGFKGGLSTSVFDPVENQSFVNAQNLDVFGQKNVLKPLTTLAGQATNPAMSSAKIETFFHASNNTFYWLGNSGTSNQLRIFKGSPPSTPGTITLSTVGTSANSSTAPDQFEDGANSLQGFHHIVELAGYLLFWTGDKLSRLLLSSETYTEDPYTFSVTSNTGHCLFVHQGLRAAFIAVDNKLYKLDSTTVSGSSAPQLVLTLDDTWVIKSMCEQGRFVAIGCIAKRDNVPSKIFIYDGSATTVDDIINVGDFGLQAIRNVNGVIHVITASVTSGMPLGYIRIYLVSGDSSVFGDEILITPGTEATNPGIRLLHLIDDACVDVWGDRIYWTMRGYTSGFSSGYLNITNGIYAYGKFDTNEPRILTLNNTTSTSATGNSFTRLRVIRGFLAVCFNNGTTWVLETQLSNATYGDKSTAGIYESNAIVLNGGLPGKIKRIVINHKPIVASTGFTVQVKHYGHYPWDGTVPSEDSYVALTTGQGSGSSAGKTQATAGATFTEIKGNELFREARYAQIKILFDQTSTVNAPEIIFPILVETT